MVNSNIAHLLNGFLAFSEFENVIFCRVLHEQHILDDLINALDLSGWTTQLDTVKIDVSTSSPADAARRITAHMAGVQAAIANRK